MTRITRLGSLALIALLYTFNPGPASAAGGALRLDCGTSVSAVMAGYERLTAQDFYSPARGYGWESEGARSVEFKNPGPLRPYTVPRDEIFADNVTDLNRDAVVSEGSLGFRADVPAGRYRVALTLGDMTQAIGSMDVVINGGIAAAHAAAWTPGGYRGFIRDPYGWWANVRSAVEAKDGVIRIEIKKSQSYYDEQMAAQEKMENPFKAWWSFAKEKDPPYTYIGLPFVENSVMAIVIEPERPAPVIGENDKLRLAQAGGSPSLSEAIEKFNARDFEGSLAALEKANGPDDGVAKALVQLWLAGRPEVEKDKTLVPAALNVLKKAAAADPSWNGVVEAAQDAEDFMKAMDIHLRRGAIGTRNHFIENDKALGRWWLIGEDTPLYYKSQLYLARVGHMLAPYIPTLGVPEQIFKKLEQKFPDNRFVKYFLHWEWAPYGDGTHFEDWILPDRRSITEGAPKWVQSLYPAWANLLDWSEWFIKFKQQPQGTIGGGWGDDVEVVGLFGYMGYTGRGVSDLAIQGARNLVDGMWNFSEINTEAGYCAPNADAEHSAEWTGNTLGMMVQIDYGNPTWIERSMKTAKLIRDLWTDYDKNGQRRFRANFMGASQVGSGDQANDAWINYRAVRPASAVWWYNQNPTIAKLYTEIADAWLASSLSSERGKPRGIIPAQVSFPDALLGGTHSPNWWMASHPKGTVNYDWEEANKSAYKGYLHDMLLTAYRSTGDPKYLEPMRLEYELAAKHGAAPESVTGARMEIPAEWEKDRLARQAEAKAGGTPDPEGSEAWTAKRLGGVEAWLTAKRLMEGRKGGLENDITKDEIVRYSDYISGVVKKRWPLMTTESSATDRADFVASCNAFFLYTGAKWGGAYIDTPITYENTTREFCAAVLAQDGQGFRILYYSLAPEAREIGIVPWALEEGGRYQLTYGPDSNDDDKMDTTAGTSDFELVRRGTPIPVKVKPRTAYVIELKQLKRGKAPALAPDPGLSAGDIGYDRATHTILARIHNAGSAPIRNVPVAAYDGDPKAGGTLIGDSLVPNLEAPTDLEPRTVLVGFSWIQTQARNEIYIVVDPDGTIDNEITKFNNVAHCPITFEASAAKGASRSR